VSSASEDDLDKGKQLNVCCVLTFCATTIFLIHEVNLICQITRRVTLGIGAFSVVAPRIWNGFPAAVRSLTALTTFCRELKTVLFHSSFCPYTYER